MEVLSGSSAEDKGISAGDVIVEVNQEGVRNAKDIEERLKALKDDGRKNALLMVSSKEVEDSVARLAQMARAARVS